MTLEKSRNADTDKIKRLYREAFPLRERKPFWFISALIKRGVCELLTAADEGGNFCGFAANIRYKDMLLVDYLAVSPEMRGRRIGGGILKQISEKYPGMRIFLEIESPEEGAKNNAQRRRRKSFYLKKRFN
jgi:N-acetylglutamate synthase-like GNAT family acetyltransferase